MVQQTINLLLNEATDELNLAENELGRPHEDVVAMAVCSSTKYSIRKLLTCFLVHHFAAEYPNRDVERKLRQLEVTRINKLLEECGKINSVFTSLDTTPLECCKMTMDSKFEGYCLGVEKVKGCTKLGRDIERIVRQSTRSY